MIAWIDLETTGLNPNTCGIVEVACIVTDKKLNEVGSYECVVNPNDFLIVWDTTAMEMHKSSGLYDKAWLSNKKAEDADKELYSFLVGIHDHGKFVPLTLGGQSVHFDRSFIERYMPKTNSTLSHRQIDVSGFKLFTAFSLGGDSAKLPPFKTNTTHRAMDDIRASIEAAKWYRSYFFPNVFPNPDVTGKVTVRS